MHLTFRNVNVAFQSIVEGIDDGSIKTVRTPSRNGPVIQIEQPVIITYTHPRERVLFNLGRDANPFMHLYESLWMLAGRNDVAPLDYYMGGKYSAFSDDGKTANGAYGYRWRHAETITGRRDVGADFYYDQPRTHVSYFDQLKIIIDHLRRKPESRRVVLQMWNVEDDLLKIDSSKDVACNTAVYFSIRTEHPDKSTQKQTPYGMMSPHASINVLDMTVTNRSNDVIWGMFGANAVHFSFLQEYIACALGIEVGQYHQFSNNAHIYTETNSGWHPEKWLAEYRNRTMHSPRVLSYGKGLNDASGNVGLSGLLFVPSHETVEDFDTEVKYFVDEHCGQAPVKSTKPNNLFLRNTAHPAMAAFYYYKQKDFTTALEWCGQISGADWRVACETWIQKRKENFEKKGQTNE